jgi:hypothetical protein
MEKNNFQLINKPGTLTHFPRNGTSPTVIDLTFAKGDINNRIQAWSANPDTTSDHAMCSIMLDIQPPNPQAYRSWAKTDWGQFFMTLT